MHAWILAHEPTIRLGCFLGVLAVMALWEIRAPRRPLSQSKVSRWSNNLGLVFINSFVVRLLVPSGAVGMAAFATTHGWGIFNHFKDIPFWVTVLGSVVVLDFFIYMQHAMFHALPLLWRLHRVHHADLDYDVTTGARFHPIEIMLSLGIKCAAIGVLGVPVLAVILFEVILNAMAMFNHGNVRLPLGIDGALRWIVVTPDMHRVHHSVEEDETNSNFGFNLSCWDRIMGTYRAQPRAGHEGMTIGIDTYRDPRDVIGLPGLMILPIRGKISAYTINRRSWQ
jgi:sterol desaturase/sphingolipid hydroxylase (fatty acid hydroxylase superfamily)